jgi:hypothetical protein
VWLIALKIKIRYNCLFCARNTLHWQRYTQAESENMENDMPRKWKVKASRSNYTYT